MIVEREQLDRFSSVVFDLGCKPNDRGGDIDVIKPSEPGAFWASVFMKLK